MQRQIRHTPHNPIWARVTQALRRVRSRVPQLLGAAMRHYRRGGLKSVTAAASRKMREVFAPVPPVVLHHDAGHPILPTWHDVLALRPQQPIIFFPSRVPWNLPMFQRPHHIAKHLAHQGFTYVFATPNTQGDQFFGFHHVSEGLFITDQAAQVAAHHPKILHLYSTDLQCDTALLKHHMAQGDQILYEYIDEIHPDISRGPIPAHVYERHDFVLRNEGIAVVATADKLYQEVLTHRHRNAALVTNGVDVAHFAQPRANKPPASIAHVVDQGKPIIGYFGTLASWFDYELLITLAKRRPDLTILLIGIDYDHSMRSYHLERYSNIYRHPAVAYTDLPNYAAWFDIAMLPFRINAVTDSTSPVKLFEYMAANKPIVSTPMPECRKYRSVLIGHTHDAFLDQVNVALNMRNDPVYTQTLADEARANAWQGKAADIAVLLRNRV